MTSKKIPKELKHRALEVFRDLCEWCGKHGSKDCESCQIEEARVVVEITEVVP